MIKSIRKSEEYLRILWQLNIFCNYCIIF